MLPLLALIAFAWFASVSSAGTRHKKKPAELSYSVELAMEGGITTCSERMNWRGKVIVRRT